MPSVVPGYEYDIFISYRQKDNRSDQWVTKFVQALKEELDATFKEDISIYFDENPHDGLLETHEVDQSLNEKVKALIFIPIVSQTYCDPNCFAWQHEFLAFRDFAKNDEFGLNIKLANGNVAKRILPIRIHEIEDADQQLFEKEISGIIRSIDFIYNSAGVNRPLRANEEHPDDNINKTIYRDQINKIANAIKDIINGLIDPVQTETPQPKDDKQYSSLIKTEKSKPSLIKKAVLSIITILIITIGIIILRSINGNNQPLVLLMDSAHPSRVYDDETLQAGATNADALSDILLDLPIKRQREAISPSWHRHEEMLDFNPDLIVIHYSGFRQENSDGPRLKIKLLIEYFMDSKTRFLIYSRRDEEVLKAAVDDLLKDLYQDQSGLNGRIEVFGLFNYGEPKWKDPIVASMLKLKVKKILNFE